MQPNTSTSTGGGKNIVDTSAISMRSGGHTIVVTSPDMANSQILQLQMSNQPAEILPNVLNREAVEQHREWRRHRDCSNTSIAAFSGPVKPQITAFLRAKGYIKEDDKAETTWHNWEVEDFYEKLLSCLDQQSTELSKVELIRKALADSDTCALDPDKKDAMSIYMSGTQEVFERFHVFDDGNLKGLEPHQTKRVISKLYALIKEDTTTQQTFKQRVKTDTGCDTDSKQPGDNEVKFAFRTLSKYTDHLIKCFDARKQASLNAAGWGWTCTEATSSTTA